MIAKRHFVRMNWVRAVDPFPQPDHPLNTPPEQDSNSNILNVLNNDCLVTVFKKLEVFDLLNVAETCVRFNHQAKEAFRLKFKHLGLQPRPIDGVLNNFGSLLQSLEIACGNINTLQTIDRQCKQLKSLTLFTTNCNWTDVRLIFGRLETLKLNRCELNNFSSIDLILQIKHLELDECEFGPRQLFFGPYHAKQFRHNTLHRWFTMCPLLEKLSLRNHQSKFNSTIFRLIDENLNNLNSLEIDEQFGLRNGFQNDVLSIGNLRSLTTLVLNFNELSVAPLANALAANKIPIEHFKIIKSQFDNDAVESVTQLERLKILELVWCINWSEDHVILLAQELSNLEELQLYSNQHIGYDTNRLKQLIKYANKL